MTDVLIWSAVMLASAGSVLWGWRRWHPSSFWYAIGFPIRALVIYGTWRSVASGCGLSRRRRQLRWTFPGIHGIEG